MNSNVVLICNNGELAKEIKSKILLLRNNDSFLAITEKNCFEDIKSLQPSLIFYHIEENNDNFINFINKVKQNPDLKTCSIIAIFDFINENILCNAFENGLTDFIQTTASESEFTVRTIWCLKRNEYLTKAKCKNNILSQLQIIDEKNDVYTENYTYTILNEACKKNWGTFVVVAPDIDMRSKISPDMLMSVIRKNVRTDDFLGFASDFKIYMWFKETTKNNTLKILEKIQKSLTSNFTFSAGFLETINLPFDKVEELANNALSKALLKKNFFLYAQEEKKNDLNYDDNIHNFKINKENFLKKLENTLSPLFYQVQKRLEEKLFETKITQSVDEDTSYFCLENKNGKSIFYIKSSGYTQITIEIIHETEKEEIKPQKIFMEKEDFGEERISYLLDIFIKHFQYYTSN